MIHFIAKNATVEYAYYVYMRSMDEAFRTLKKDVEWAVYARGGKPVGRMEYRQTGWMPGAGMLDLRAHIAILQKYEVVVSGPGYDADGREVWDYP